MKSPVHAAAALCVTLIVAALVVVAQPAQAASGPVIVVGEDAPRLERLASREVQRYLYHLTGDKLEVITDAEVADYPDAARVVLGQRDTNALIADMSQKGLLPSEDEAPGSEGYVVRTVSYEGRDAIAVMASDANGTLYGSYELLERYGARFYIDGDELPEQKQPFAIKQLDVSEEPAVDRRGLLPWHDFLNGPSGYSYEDFKEYLDQMAKMKMNTLVLHNYADGVGGRPMNEPFLNFEWRGTGHDGWLDTSVDNQRWGMAPFTADDLAFAAGDYFPYDIMGSDAARYTKEQADAQKYIFLKAKAMMQKTIRYAQSRGMEIVLGTDFDIAPREILRAGGDPLDPEILKARIDDILTTYPTLKYIQFHFHEHASIPSVCGSTGTCTTTAEAIEALRFAHDYLKQRRPNARLLTGGWFQEHRFPEMDAALPEDIIFSTLLPHDMSLRPEWARLKSDRELWPIPWMEHDADLSQPQFGVTRMAEQLPKFRELGIEGEIGILWRTGMARTNVAYLAQDAWQPAGSALDPRDFYRDYAAHAFGEEVADEAVNAFLDIEATGFPKLSGATVEFGKWNFCGCPTDEQVETYSSIKERFAALRPQVTGDGKRENLEYYISFMDWMERFWTAQERVPEAVRKATAVRGVYHVDAGGQGEGDLKADFGYSLPSNPASFPNAVTPNFGYPSAMRTERWAADRPLAYSFSDAPNGPYRIELYFHEGYFGVLEPGDPVGKRVFDIEIEGEVVRPDFDPAKAAGGPLKGIRLVYETQVEDGELTIRFVNKVSNPKVDIIKAMRIDEAGNPDPVPPSPEKVREAWADLKDSGFREAIEAYKGIVSDMPSQGGLLSAAGGRWYGPAYKPLEHDIISRLPAPPPEHVVARGTGDGARITWRPRDTSSRNVGYHVFRRPASGGEFERLTTEPVTSTFYEDRAEGEYVYAVTAVAQEVVNPSFLVDAGGQGDGDLEPDHGYYGNTQTAEYGNPVANDFGYPQAMRSVRWCPSSCGYRFNVPSSETTRYRVELYFAEIAYGVVFPGDPAGKRVFDIAINGNSVRENFDIAKTAGGANKGIKLTFDVPVTGHTLDISFSPVVAEPAVNAIRAYPIDADGNPQPKEYGPEAESPRSYEEWVQAGGADDIAPRVLRIPRNLEAVRGEPLRVTALAVDQRHPDEVSATLHHRVLGEGEWKTVRMQRNPLARPYAFFADIPAKDVGNDTLEYYISATDGANTSYAPAGAPQLTASALVVPRGPEIPGTVPDLTASWDADRGGVMLTWQPAPAALAHQYNIYRSTTPGFTPSRATYVTYVPSQQRVFLDVNVKPGTTYYYRIEPETIEERTGPATREVSVAAPPR